MCCIKWHLIMDTRLYGLETQALAMLRPFYGGSGCGVITHDFYYGGIFFA